MYRLTFDHLHGESYSIDFECKADAMAMRKQIAKEGLTITSGVCGDLWEARHNLLRANISDLRVRRVPPKAEARDGN
ncbi:MAG: hypothetical protein C4542_02975 [Dehalococcoidia bacterium]|nr:MAG: hypothetical protein C4542_02975 [Dehalococcoidia bacterium]